MTVTSRLDLNTTEPQNNTVKRNNLFGLCSSGSSPLRSNKHRIETYRLGFLVLELEKLQSAVCLQRAVQVPDHFVHFSDNSVVSQSLTYKIQRKQGGYLARSDEG